MRITMSYITLALRRFRMPAWSSFWASKSLVLFQDGNRNIQQTDRCRYVGLVPFADDPEVAVEAGADVVGLQLADVDIGESREAAEDKQVADLFKPPGGDRWP